MDAKLGAPCKYMYSNKKQQKKIIIMSEHSVCYVYLHFFLCAHCSYVLL